MLQFTAADGFYGEAIDLPEDNSGEQRGNLVWHSELYQHTRKTHPRNTYCLLAMTETILARPRLTPLMLW